MMIHHSAICTSDIDKSLAFWRDGLGFEVSLDEHFEGELDHAAPRAIDVAAVSIPRLSRMPSPRHRECGCIWTARRRRVSLRARPLPSGFLPLSVMSDVNAVLAETFES